MKKVLRVLSLIVAPVVAVCAFLTGCKSCKGKPVSTPQAGNFNDVDVSPDELMAQGNSTITAYYEAQTKQVIDEYLQVAALHTDSDGEVDTDNEEVAEAACSAAAKLYAFACYNERYLDQYVYFSDQIGTTDLGSTLGSATARRQEYFLRVNENENSCGYRYHRTIKKVLESSGTIDMFKTAFEQARIRMTDQTNLLYRFEGNSIKTGDYNENLGCDVLTCDWRTGENWGTPDVAMVKGSELATLEEIKADILVAATDDNRNIHANINILAENIVKSSNIFIDDDGLISVLMTINTEVANADEASMTMLQKSNGTSGNCNWIPDPETADQNGFANDTGLRIIFTLWPNGLFKSYTIIERWKGKMDLAVAKPTGLAESTTMVNYSYSDGDCDMSAYLAMIEEGNSKL